jgi:hypothetical protein
MVSGNAITSIFTTLTVASMMFRQQVYAFRGKTRKAVMEIAIMVSKMSESSRKTIKRVHYKPS